MLIFIFFVFYFPLYLELVFFGLFFGFLELLVQNLDAFIKRDLSVYGEGFVVLEEGLRVGL